MKLENNPIIYRKDYQPPNYLVKSVSLGFMIEPEYTRVKSKIHFYRHSDSVNNQLELNGVDIELISIAIDGTMLETNEYEISEETLKIFEVPEKFELQVENKIYPSKNKALEGLYQSGNFLSFPCIL